MEVNIGDKLFSHIIDPRTNAPVESDVLSATVIAPNLMEAEMVSKTCLILGSEQGTINSKDL